jgi:hypothetical protein
MVGQFLPNNNKSVTRIFPPNISDLNTACFPSEQCKHLRARAIFLWGTLRQVPGNPGRWTIAWANFIENRKPNRKKWNRNRNRKDKNRNQKIRFLFGFWYWGTKITEENSVPELIEGPITWIILHSLVFCKIIFGLCVVFYIWIAIYLCYYIVIIFLYIIIIIKNKYSVA